VKGIAVKSIEGAACPIKNEPPFTGEYTTGNTIVKPEEASGAHTDGWWE
jgi:hypothetical protein